MRDIEYKNDRQYARVCSNKIYDQRQSYEMKFNPISNELYKKDYNYLRDDQKRNVKEQFNLRTYN